MIHLLVELRLTRQWFTQCRIFASAKIKTNESIIIRSTVRVSVRYTYNNECCERVRPVSDVAGPNIPTALSSSSIFAMAVIWFCSCSDSVLRTGSMSPAIRQLFLSHLFGYRPCCLQVANLPAQGLTSIRCACYAAGTSRSSDSDCHMQAGYTLLIAQFRPRSDG